MSTAFVFPGQGSQAVGMGRALAEAFAPAREAFEEVDEALRQRLTRLMFEGPESELTLTENAQPALMAVSLAVVRVLEREGGVKIADRIAFVAGHSLGEYSALAAAGALPLGDTARLLKRRGRAMQEAVPVGEGAMAALLGADLEAAKGIAETAAKETRAVCTPPTTTRRARSSSAGPRPRSSAPIELAGERGIKRSVLLPVSAPFHCPLMQPAADAMAEALGEAALVNPSVPLVANVTARSVVDAGTIRTLLVEQVTGLVRWRESVLFMKEQGVDRLVEIGAGKVLSGLAKRIDREIAASSVGEPAEIEALLKSL